MKPGKVKTPSTTYSPLLAVKSKTVAENILFLLAMSGCDTTSAPFNQRKLKFVKALTKNPDLGDVIKVFKNSNATPQSITEAGERFLVEVYGHNGRTAPSLNHRRFLNYKNAAFKAS